MPVCITRAKDIEHALRVRRRYAWPETFSGSIMPLFLRGETSRKERD